jgi:CheY-like chemotaxis protein
MSQPRYSLSQSVLFIDDQTKFESLIRGGLFSYPAEYEFCPSRISTAVERFKGERPDLIVTTMEFLDGTALDLIRSAPGYLERVPAVFISEPHLADLEAQLAQQGRFQVVERAVDPLNLIRKMAQAIAEGGAQGILNEGDPAPLAQLGWADAIIKKIK